MLGVSPRALAVVEMRHEALDHGRIFDGRLILKGIMDVEDARLPPTAVPTP